MTPLWDENTRRMVHGAIEETVGEGMNVNRPDADTLIAQAQSLGIQPLHLRTWIYEHHPKLMYGLDGADDWSGPALEAWAHIHGYLQAQDAPEAAATPLPLGYSREGDTVTLRMTVEDYENVLLLIGYGTGAGSRDGNNAFVYPNARAGESAERRKPVVQAVRDSGDEAVSTKKPIYMESTEIPADRSAAEVSSILMQAGATSVSVRYAEGKVTGMTWTMRVGATELQFSMPARVDPVYKLLLSRRSGHVDNAARARIMVQAERVAWRQLLRWVQAQLAMIEVGMVQRGEVFMPYIQQADGSTFFEYFESKQLQLPAAETKP